MSEESSFEELIHINYYDACYSSQVADRVVFSIHISKKLLRVAYIAFLHCPIESVKIPQMLEGAPVVLKSFRSENS